MRTIDDPFLKREPMGIGTGTPRNDLLYGGKGSDNDTLIGLGGNDTLNGRDGIDVAVFSGNFADYVVTYDDSLGAYVLADKVSGRDGTDTVLETENFQFADGTRTASQLMTGTGIGTSGTDFLVGSSSSDSIQGLDGNDSIDAGGGNDTLGGGSGYDRLIAGAGDDLLLGGPGNDWLAGNAGSDTLDGGAGSDTAFFTSAAAAVTASLLTGIAVGEGTDQLVSIESLQGGAFGDTLTGNSSSNELIGEGGNDSLYGGGGADALYGGAGDDLLDGGEGRDVASYWSGTADVAVDADLLRGTAFGEGTDTFIGIEDLAGSNANDRLAGDDAANYLQGINGNDVLLGRGGNDDLYGGKGNDTITGGAGDDSIRGDDGTDSVVYSGFRSEYTVTAAGGEYRVTDLVVDRDGTDRLLAVEYLQFADQRVSLLPDQPAPAPTPPSPGNTYNGTSGADSLYGSKGDDTLNGFGGADLLKGSNGNDQLFGGDGDDTLDGWTGNDTFNGGSGVDTVIYAGVGDVTVSLLLTSSQDTHSIADADTLIGIENLRGATGNDVLTGNSLSNRLDGDWGNDTLDGWTGADQLYGAMGDDTFIVDNAGDVVVENPGEGSDIVLSSVNYVLGPDVENLMLAGNAVSGSGNSLSNRIVGNSLGNILAGGAGNDTLDGGQGADVAVYSQARSQYLWVATPTGYTVADQSGAEGIDVLTGVERLRFADTKFALDLGGDAGFVARLIGVLVNPSAVGNKQLVGTGLSILDGGASYDSLVDRALHAIFGAQPTNVQLVDLLYANVMEAPPSAEIRAAFTGMLERGVYTQVSLTRFAAGLDLNASNIHLTGLQATGLEYL